MNALNKIVPLRSLRKEPPQPTWIYSSKVLAKQLGEKGYCDAVTARRLLQEAREAGRSYVSKLLEEHVLSGTAMRDALADIFGLSVATLEPETIDEHVIQRFPAALARRHRILPLVHRDGHLVVAVADPTMAAPLQALQQTAKQPLEIQVASVTDLDPLIDYHFAPKVEIQYPNGTKSEVIVPMHDLMIGRSDLNHVVLDDPWVSSTHAVLKVQGASTLLVDFGSRNGTFLNGEMIYAPTDLHHGDHFQIGRYRLVFKWRYEKRLRRLTDPEALAKREQKKRRKQRKQSRRIQAAWIAFTSRILAHALGAVSMLILGLAIAGGFPGGCAPTTQKPEGSNPASSVIGAFADLPSQRSDDRAEQQDSRSSVRSEPESGSTAR